jgi:hypothetical protein
MAFKIIQSFFYHPDRLAGGWLSPTYNLVSWALSCHQLRQHYEQVELVTDAFGKHLLIDQLRLPYTQVRVEPDLFRHYPDHLWAINKLVTYARQTEPFLHVDGDIFCWQPLTKAQADTPLVVQNIEHTSYYFPYLRAMRDHFAYVPEALRPCLELEPVVPPSINAGVLGGTDVAFIRAYAEEALHAIDRNLPYLRAQQSLNNYNVVFEQLLFFELARQQHVPITTLQPDNFQLAECPVEHLGRSVHYLHPLGAFKRNFRLCEALVMHLNAHYPDAYARIRAATAPAPPSTREHRQRLFDRLADHYAPQSAQRVDLTTYQQAYAALRPYPVLLPATLSQQHAQTASLLRLDDAALAGQSLSLNTGSVVVDTRWNWSIGTPIDLCQPDALEALLIRYGQKRLDKTQPSRTVILWHPAAERTVEVNLQNEVHQVLLDGFRHPASIGSVVTQVRRRFPEYEADQANFTAFLLDSVRYLVSTTVLAGAANA